MGDTVAINLGLEVSVESLQDMTVEVFRPTLAAMLPGVTEDMIISFEVTQHTSLRRRNLFTDTATVSVILRASLDELGFSTASEMKGALSSTLNEAVSDGSFNAILQGECGCSVSVESVT